MTYIWWNFWNSVVAQLFDNRAFVQYIITFKLAFLQTFWKEQIRSITLFVSSLWKFITLTGFFSVKDCSDYQYSYLQNHDQPDDQPGDTIVLLLSILNLRLTTLS